MESSKSPYSSGGQFPTIYSHNPCLVTACRSRSRDRALHTPYWARNNVDFSRQEELKLFDKMRRDIMVPVGDNSAVCIRDLPSVKKNKIPSAPLPLEVRRYQTFPSGLRRSLEDRTVRDVFFECR
nr:PREDICTED: UPF0573 protein C2orf70 homolog [Lepisosteus oculatus]